MTETTSPKQLISISLGPLFPRFLAVYLGLIIVSVCWLPALLATWAEQSGRLTAFVFGLFVLAFLFLPSLGTLNIDIAKRVMTYRESVTAKLLHPWNWRSEKSIGLDPGSRILIGMWLKPDAAFEVIRVGIRRISADGKCDIFIEDRFAENDAIASQIVDAVKSFGDIEVETLKLNATFQEVPWTPVPGRTSSFIPAVFILPFVGFLAAVQTSNRAVLSALGIVSLIGYSLYLLRYLRRNGSNTGNLSVGFAAGWSIFQFAVLYFVLSLLGTTMR